MNTSWHRTGEYGGQHLIYCFLVPPNRVEGGTLVFDVDDVSVQLPGEIKYEVIV